VGEAYVSIWIVFLDSERGGPLERASVFTTQRASAVRPLHEVGYSRASLTSLPLIQDQAADPSKDVHPI